MKVLSVVSKKSQKGKNVNLVFALYTHNVFGDLICLSCHRNYWEAKKRFLELKNNFFILYHDVILVECSESYFLSSLKNIRNFISQKKETFK